MDLGQVEVIKGVASALYGAGAMGGVIDLISRRPADAPEREVLLNQSTRGGTDAVLWYSTPPVARWGVHAARRRSLPAAADVDDDGWADLPDYARGVLRPRLFWDDGNGRSFFATVGVTAEYRVGGTLPRQLARSPGTPSRSARHPALDGGFVGQDPCSAAATSSPSAAPRRASVTTTGSATCSSATGTTRSSAR